MLELAYRQEEHEYCNELVKLAEEGSIELVLPAYSLTEPYETLVRRDRQRRDIHRRLTDELTQLGRSASYADAAAKLGALTGILVDSGEQEMLRLNDVIRRLVRATQLVPADATIVEEALRVQLDLGLSPQDSIVYSSLRARVVKGDGPQCFINKNTEDFLIPQIKNDFEAHGCKLIGSFQAGLSYVRSVLERPTRGIADAGS